MAFESLIDLMFLLQSSFIFHYVIDSHGSPLVQVGLLTTDNSSLHHCLPIGIWKFSRVLWTDDPLARRTCVQNCEWIMSWFFGFIG